MLSAAPLLCAVFLALTSHARLELEARQKRTHSHFLSTCHKIAAEVSSASQVYFPPSPQYTSDNHHYALSSSQESACSVEPGSAADVSKILEILGSRRTPFAVKGGGHSTNPGFSSTPGVQIALTRLNSTRVNAKDRTVEIGPGLTWDQVYETLGPTGVNVVGGRTAGVGVAGSTLGGGYSYKTSQYGLIIDNVAGFELVLPNGAIKHVTQTDEDLWFGLRGGLNNFGIVTKFILKSHLQVQTDVWGGILIYTEDKLDQLKDSFVKFQKINDTKAAMIFSFASTSGQMLAVITLFYDAPTRPVGVFDDFLAIQAAQGNVSTMSYSDFIISSSSVESSTNSHLFYEGVSVTRYSPAVFDALLNHTRFWGPRISALDSTALVTSTLEPFDSGLFSHSHGSPSAYPPDRSKAVFPSVLTIAWANASFDDNTVIDILHGSAKTIRDVTLADGQDLSKAAVYVNYALFDTPLEDMYGRNVARLHRIKTEIDPDGVMDLAGGFKF